MSENFLKRFKGKTETMGKEGAGKLGKQQQGGVKLNYSIGNNQNTYYQANNNTNNIQRNYLDFNSSYGNLVNNPNKQAFARKQTFYTQPKPNYQYPTKQQQPVIDTASGSKRKVKKENKPEVS